MPCNIRQKIEVVGGCWVWIAARQSAGYGSVSFLGRKGRLAHRVVYELLVGEIPRDRECDHLCRNRTCVNPEHIDLVTSRENTARGDAPRVTKLRHAKRTQCPSGHPYDEANTVWYTKKGYRCRSCRACERARQR